MRIVSKGLMYSYNPKEKNKIYALNGVDLTVEEGDFFGIVGKTGSGKSTFIQHLNGIVKVQKNSGELTVGEFNLSENQKIGNELRKKVGMVFQYPEYQLFAETVFLDVAFGLKNFYPNLTETEVFNAVKTAIETVGLDFEKVKDKSPFDLSGGQKRRVAIAGVIVSRPEILILDEPASGLDPKGKIDLMNLLHDLHRSFVKTVVIVSHDMNIITENCNKVAVFANGKVVKCGCPNEVFTDEEEMRSYGLNLPTVVYLERRLSAIGVNVGSDLTAKDFAEKVAKLLKEGSL